MFNSNYLLATRAVNTHTCTISQQRLIWNWSKSMSPWNILNLFHSNNSDHHCWTTKKTNIHITIFHWPIWCPWFGYISFTTSTQLWQLGIFVLYIGLIVWLWILYIYCRRMCMDIIFLTVFVRQTVDGVVCEVSACDVRVDRDAIRAIVT